MNKQLARISKAGLEIKERGILNFWIFVDYEEGCSQGVGGIALDTYDPDRKERVGTAYGCEMIRQVLIALNVNDFSEMKGKQVWIYGEGDGLDFSPCGIGSLRTESDKPPVIFADVAKQMIPPKERIHDWQPIESAPKDRTVIMLGNPDCAWVGRFIPVYQSGYKPDNPWASLMLNRQYSGVRHPSGVPTHWMPLPTPPKPPEQP